MATKKPTKDQKTEIKIVDDEERKKRLARLTPFNELTPEEHRRRSALGGKRAAEKRRANKTFKEAVEMALNLPAIKGNPTVDKLMKAIPDLTNREALAIAITAEGIKKQNVRAFEALRDTTGELPAQTVNVQTAQPMTINIKTIE